MWKSYSFEIENDFTTRSDTVRFINNGSMAVVMCITNIKIENGKVKTLYSPSLYDIIHMHQHPPIDGQLGSVRPDNKTITIDAGGYLHVVKGTEESAAFIDDENISESEPMIKPKNRTKKDVSDKAETLFYTLDEKEFTSFMSNISLEEKNYIKLEMLKRIIEFKLKIKEQIVFNPGCDISKIQEDLNRARQVLTLLNEEKIEEENIEEKENSKVLILPNKKNNTYLYDDICDNIESAKEIKNTIDKVIDGYFLKTKDIKPILGKTEKLYEYKHPNGIRILYIVLPNDYVVITGLFYKDKDKSTRIEAFYDESINRYLYFKDYINSNIENPEFHIEQAELIGNIFDLFEKTIKKEKGE